MNSFKIIAYATSPFIAGLGIYILTTAKQSAELEKPKIVLQHMEPSGKIKEFDACYPPSPGYSHKENIKTNVISEIKDLTARVEEYNLLSQRQELTQYWTDSEQARQEILPILTTGFLLCSIGTLASTYYVGKKIFKIN